MSFGRRLALFFLLLVIVPMAALVLLLLFVSEDARRGKADARLAAGMATAIAVYEERAAEGFTAARELGRRPATAAAMAADRRDRLEALARRELARPGTDAAAVRILGRGGTELAAAGPPNAIAFGGVRVVTGGRELGTVRVSAITAPEYADEVQRLTSRELVLIRGAAPLATTVEVPQSLPEAGRTVDLDLSGGEYRARQQPLDPGSGEAILLLGPRREGGLLAIGRPAALMLAAFLLVAGALAWMLTRQLSGLHDRVTALAITDPLTGLWNRRRMQELLEREAERQRRFGRPYSFLIVDVDEFKSINDRHGHPVGDAVLEQIAETIREETRSLDEAIRYGGDEFALVLSETGAQGAVILAERLRERVAASRHSLPGGEEMGVTVSLGIATAPDNAESTSVLVRAADDALLQAKRAGKNRIMTAPPGRPRSPA